MQQVCIDCSDPSFPSPRICVRGWCSVKSEEYLVQVRVRNVQSREVTEVVSMPFCRVLPLVGKKTDWSEAKSGQIWKRGGLMDGVWWVEGGVPISPSFICCVHALNLWYMCASIAKFNSSRDVSTAHRRFFHTWHQMCVRTRNTMSREMSPVVFRELLHSCYSEKLNNWYAGWVLESRRG